MPTTTVEVRPAIRRIVHDTPGRAARSLRNIERQLADPNLSASERDRLTPQAVEFRAALAEAHRCRRCGKEITHPDSIEDGLGRECVTKAGA